MTVSSEMPSGAPAALEISNLAYAYGDRVALRDVSFTVSKGEFKVLLGPNGAGKTTLFSLVARFLVSREGKISVDGRDLHTEPGESLKRMGIVFQSPTLDLDLTVQQNLSYHAALHGMDRNLTARRIDEELGRLGLSGMTDRKLRQLNGGHRRRVEIARALLHQPEILLLDEATVGLDVPTRRDLVDYFHRLAKDQKIAVLSATHLIDEVYENDSIIVLHNGRVVADGTTADILHKTGTHDLLAAFNQLTERADG